MVSRDTNAVESNTDIAPRTVLNNVRVTPVLDNDDVVNLIESQVVRLRSTVLFNSKAEPVILD